MFNIRKSFELYKLSREYKNETLKYVSKINTFRKEEHIIGVSTKQPIDTREFLAEKIYPYIMLANKYHWVPMLRRLFPPQTEIFYDLTKEKEYASTIIKIITLENNSFLVVIDSPNQFNEKLCLVRNVYVTNAKTSFQLLENVWGIGVCPQKKIYCYVDDKGITLSEGWKGSVTSFIPWPKSDFYFSNGIRAKIKIDQRLPLGDVFIPFSDGNRVLVGGDRGLFLLEQGKTTIIYPDEKELNECNLENESTSKIEFDMFHFALSHNNQYIALGHQASLHNLYSATGILLGQVDTLSSYPHYAVFSKDDQQVAFNSCHFYNGASLAVPIQDVIESTEEYYENSIIKLDEYGRIYAAVATSFGYILGDAFGYLYARGYDGSHLWDDYLGFNIRTMDISSDENFLYVGTYKGIIYKIALNTDKRDFYRIGDSTNKEVCRWMFWEKDQILLW